MSDLNKNKPKQSSTSGIAITPVKFEAIKPTEVPLTNAYQQPGGDQRAYSNTYGGNSYGDNTYGANTLGSNPQTAKKIPTPSELWRQHRTLVIAVPLILVALLVVIFVLPSQVEKPSVSAAHSDEAKTVPTPAKPSGPAESPWTDAQFAKQRRETQDILAKLLDRQRSLESIHVDRWAAQSFEEATLLAAQADTLYREQDFAQSKSLYEQVLQSFDQLLKQSETVFSTNLDSGFTAIADGNSKAAQEHFQVAALIHPESTEAQTGLERAQVLDQVTDLIRQGSRHQRQGEFDEAKRLFAQALQVDGQSSAAQSKLNEINAAIKEREYAKAMSLGFSALNQGNFDQAAQHFQQALKIKPGAADAQAAIVQAKNQNTQSTLQQLINNAVSAETNEQWQQAVDNYNQALKLDNNLVQAKVGKIKAEHRAQIDQRLVDILNNPDRLTSDNVFKEYQQLGREVRDMANRGPRLQQQFEQLEQAMRRAIAPVNVMLRSDNLTDVTVYQIGNLGKFQQQELTLKPGTYTVTGTRKGYRDVRQEITISANTTNNPVVVQCVEPINNG